MNRSIPPLIKEITKVELPIPEQINYSNGIPLYLTPAFDLPVLKLEIVICAGRPWEKKRLAAKITAKTLKEGVASKTSKEISAYFDFYGASLNVQFNLDYLTISLYCLTRYFDKLLPLLEEIIKAPIFPENEIETYIKNNIKKLQIDLSKPEVIAYRSITEKIFGPDHPYGYNSTEEFYNLISRQDILEHYKTNYRPSRYRIFLSGGYTDQILKALELAFGNWYLEDEKVFHLDPAFAIPPKRIDISMDTVVQSAVRMGRKLFTRNHNDYPDMFILNTLLGGFFGSRLNMNIRETKGFTYNISSSLDTFSFDGCLIISSEMSAKHINKAIKLIFNEFNILQNIPVDEAELKQLRSYLMGSLIMAIDGPFNANGIIKTLVADGVSLNLWTKVVNRIQDITANDILLLSQKYLNKKDFWVLTSGPKS
ncbi:MAG TPA: pitrilysin family protein [Saprospiraceae bacterium]|nr:pitrilysin family protein [Saprospiraceae bacterium]